MTSRKRKAAVLATVTLLAERFPAAFFTFEGQRRPLKIGIAADICEAMPEINKEHLQWALARYCMSPGYLRSLTGGAVRVGLAGDAAGTVTDEAAAKAVAMLAQVVTARRKRTAKVAREPAKTRPRSPRSRRGRPSRSPAWCPPPSRRPCACRSRRSAKPRSAAAPVRAGSRLPARPTGSRRARPSDRSVEVNVKALSRGTF